MKVLVAAPLDPAAIGILKAEERLKVVVSNPLEFHTELADCEALIVRSSINVTADVLAQAPQLKVIGRAGVGVDNIDCDAATDRGIVVMNTPGGNATSVAEHTLALILSLARSVPSASASTKAGRWEKKRFLGNEVFGKTLGIIGLGNIGRQVAQRAVPFGMEIVAYDPYVSSDAARDSGVELIDLEPLLARADYLSLHLSLTPETAGMINADTIAKMKDGVRIVNCARGELIDSEALSEAIASGKVGGAALDVYDKEPPAGSPLFTHEQVVATPHIGGATAEAQAKVGIDIAGQVRDFLNSGVVVNAVNTPSVSAEQFRRIAPYLQLAERLGSFVAQTSTGRPVRVKITYFGNFGETDAVLIRNAALSGVLNCFLSERANLVNAFQIARERAIGVSEVRRGLEHFSDSIRLALKTEDIDRTVEGAVFPDGSPRVISVDGIYVEAYLVGSILYVTNKDVPGVVGRLGTVLGANGINISSFALGRGERVSETEPAEAVALIQTDEPLPASVLDRLYRMHAVVFAKAIDL
ncbi:MAG: phosphoglycerate dehydrogenase [Bryobacterales bacterium]|nr:phosphoglycerate dehydrogenase [Bryobacterales bacterium]